MGARSFDDEIAQVPSRDGADRYFAPNIILSINSFFYFEKYMLNFNKAQQTVFNRRNSNELCFLRHENHFHIPMLLILFILG